MTSLTTFAVVVPKIVKELATAGSISGVRIQAAADGFVVILLAGPNERVLGSARGELRYFQSLDGAASVLQSCGITKFDVDTMNWIPKTVVRGYKSPAAEIATHEGV